MNPHILIKLDPRDVPENKQEIRLFATVKDEMTRLPYFMKYHRDLGVDRFFFVDNNSSDGTTEFLLAQPDTHVFHTRNAYSESRYGIDWQNDLMTRYGRDQWCLHMDADEILVYPDCETVGLKRLCAFMDREGSQALFTFMLDMYPQGKLQDAVCKPGTPFFEICPFFDRDYRFVPRIALPWKKRFPENEVLGGPRMRCFYDARAEAGYGERFAIQMLIWALSALRKLRIPVPNVSLKSPEICKIPLIKWQEGYSYELSTHVVTPVRLSAVTGVIAHFKFFSDFHDRAVKAVASGQHAGGSQEYKRYLARIDSVGDIMYEGSTKYEGSHTLLEKKLISTSRDYENLTAA